MTNDSASLDALAEPSESPPPPTVSAKIPALSPSEIIEMQRRQTMSRVKEFAAAQEGNDGMGNDVTGNDGTAAEYDDAGGRLLNGYFPGTTVG
jgi:hypothetical protein